MVIVIHISPASFTILDSTHLDFTQLINAFWECLFMEIHVTLQGIL